MKRTCLILVSCLMVGCGSATKDISRGAAEARRNARTIIDNSAVVLSHLEEVETSAVPVDIPLIRDTTVSTEASAQRIIKQADIIQDKIPEVKDRVPFWMQMIYVGLIVAGIAGVGFLLWQTGIGTFLRGAFSFAAPRAKRRASLASKLIDHQITPQEFVASERTADPAFDAQFRKKRRGKGAGSSRS